jgi:hypothetical protein
MKAKIAASVLAVHAIALLTMAPLARADQNDELYLAVLDMNGIRSSTDPAGLIGIGHDVCNAFDNGRSVSRVAVTIMDSAEQANISALETPSGAAHLIGAAIGAYCPQYQSLVGR